MSRSVPNRSVPKKYSIFCGLGNLDTSKYMPHTHSRELGEKIGHENQVYLISTLMRIYKNQFLYILEETYGVFTHGQFHDDLRKK